MIKVENIQVMNFENALRGMRNPLESWKDSDSYYGLDDTNYQPLAFIDVLESYLEKDEEGYPIENESITEKIYKNSSLRIGDEIVDCAVIGPKDLALAQKLILAGSDHSKFMRQIFVSMDITAPLYWWKEMDTYKVGTVANSCSTMHKLATTPITKDLFSFDDNLDNLECFPFPFFDTMLNIIDSCEMLRKKYLETKDIRYWRALIQLLPSAWNQTRTWTANYAVLRNIYFARSFHKLIEWREFCKIIEDLPYGEELICVTHNDIQLEKN